MSGVFRKGERATMVTLAATLALATSCAGDTTAVSNARPITSHDVALGGKEIERPVQLAGGGEFKDVLKIGNVRFTEGEAPRGLVLGVLALQSSKGSGDAVVRLRMVVDGVPEEVFAKTLPDGFSDTISIQRTCSGMPAVLTEIVATVRHVERAEATT